MVMCSVQESRERRMNGYRSRVVFCFLVGLALAAGFGCAGDAAPKLGEPNDATSDNPSAPELSVCQEQVDTCGDCRTLRCGAPSLACLAVEHCILSMRTLDGCFRSTCDIEQCLRSFSAKDGLTSSLASCVTQKCSRECWNAPPAASGGGSGGTSSVGTGGAAGAAGAAGTAGAAGAAGSAGFGLHECKLVTGECDECRRTNCEAEITACLDDESCNASALPALTECILKDCGPHCMTSFAAANGAA